MKYTRILTLIVLVSSLAVSENLTYSQVNNKPKWIFLITDSHGWKDYYDEKNVTRSSEGIVIVRAKQVPVYKTAEEQKTRMQHLLENRKWLGIDTNGYANYAYSVTVVEINCATNEGRSSTMIDYDKTEKEIAKCTLENSEWAPISPRSWMMELVPKVCKQK